MNSGLLYKGQGRKPHGKPQDYFLASARQLRKAGGVISPSSMPGCPGPTRACVWSPQCGFLESGELGEMKKTAVEFGAVH